MQIMIDGVEKEVILVTNCNYGGVYSENPYTEMRVYGKDIDGRKCIVATHTFQNIKMYINHIERGGAVRRGGHRYSLPPHIPRKR